MAATHYKVLNPILHGTDDNKKPRKHQRGSIVPADTFGADTDSLLAAGAIAPHEVEVVEVPGTAAAPADLAKLTKAELITFGKAHGIDLSETAKKEDLIAAINAVLSPAPTEDAQ